MTIGALSGSRLFRNMPLLLSREPLTPQRALELNAAPSDAARLKKLQAEVVGLRRALKGLDDVARVEPPPPVSTSGTAQVLGGTLGINIAATPATLTSKAEVNATQTSYGPFEPTWDGDGSDARVEVDGKYDGAIGGVQDQKLTVKVLTGGDVGAEDVKLGLYDEGGALIQKRTIRSYQAGTLVYFTDGLRIKLDAGYIEKNDTFDFDVYGTVGSVVDPDKAFDGTGNLRPNLEYGKTVQAGTFNVNGELISVAPDDTIQSVLARISASDAGVSASFDIASERIVLEQNTIGSGETISVGSDSSGFLAATKLSGAKAVKGTDDDRDKSLYQVNALMPIRTGKLSINGTEISINRYQDSLNEVIDRINESDAGVTASFDEADMRFKVVANDPDTDVVLGDGITRFFQTLDIVEGTYEPTGAGGPSAGDVRRVLTRQGERLFGALQSVQEGLGKVFGNLSTLIANENGTAQRYREQLSGVITGQFGSPEDKTTFRTKLGMDFDVSASSESPMSAHRSGRRSVVEAYLRNRAELQTFILGESGNPLRRGFVADLDEALEHVQRSLERTNGTQGLLVDTFV